MPSTTSSTRSPARPTCSTRDGTWARPGWGARLGAWSVSPRSTPSSRRISTRAWRPVAAIASKAPAARSGSVATATGPASACTTIMLTWWATTSCSSRAIRARSEATARRASEARSRSSRAARSRSSAASARCTRARSPSTHAPASESETKAASTTSASARGRVMTTTTTTAATPPASRAARRLPQAATEYMPTTPPMAIGMARSG